MWSQPTLPRTLGSIDNSRIPIPRPPVKPFLGPATYVTHQGERPMSITWRLLQPITSALFEEMKVAAG